MVLFINDIDTLAASLLICWNNLASSDIPVKTA